MSMIRYAVRRSAIEALRGRTYAEGRVFDSTIEPIDTKVQVERLPFIIVTSDDDDGIVTGRELTHASRSLDLVIEMAVMTKVKRRVTRKDGTVEDMIDVVIPDTDAGLELTLDLMGHQILATLQGGGGAWGDIFRDLVPAVSKFQTKRGASATDGARFAARQIILTVDTISEPIGAIEEASAFGNFLAAMRAEADLAPMADLFTDLADTGEINHGLLQATMGLSDASFAAGFFAEEDTSDVVGVNPMPAVEVNLDQG